MNQIKITFIVSAFNVDNYIEQCLHSIIKFTALKKEVLVVNDGSTDSTLEKIKKCCEIDKDIILIDQPNQGLSESRNNALKRARGEYILFVDGDDWINDICLKHALNEALQQDADVLSAPHSDCYPDHQAIFGYSTSLSSMKMQEGGILLSAIFKARCYCSAVWSYLWKRSFLEEHNLCFTPDLYHEDIEFTFSALLKAEKSLYFNQPFYCYRRDRDGSITASFNEKRLRSMAIILPRIEHELATSNYTSDKELGSHLAALSFEMLHHIILSGRKDYFTYYKHKNFAYYICKYSKTRRYYLPSLLIRAKCYTFYAILYRLFYNAKSSQKNKFKL